MPHISQEYKGSMPEVLTTPNVGSSGHVQSSVIPRKAVFSSCRGKMNVAILAMYNLVVVVLKLVSFLLEGQVQNLHLCWRELNQPLKIHRIGLLYSYGLIQSEAKAILYSNTAW